MGPQPFNFPFALGLEMFFYVLLFIFSVHALFLGYHWFAFGTDKQTSMIALAVYLGGGAIFFLVFATSLFMV